MDDSDDSAIHRYLVTASFGSGIDNVWIIDAVGPDEAKKEAASGYVVGSEHYFKARRIDQLPSGWCYWM